MLCYFGSLGGDDGVETANGREGMSLGSRCHVMVSPKSHQCPSSLETKEESLVGDGDQASKNSYR